MYLHDDVQVVVEDVSHWRWLKFLLNYTDMALTALRSTEGNVGAGTVYYAFLTIKIYNESRIQRIVESVDVPEDTENVRGYVRQNLPRGRGAQQGALTRFDFYSFAESRLMKRWRLSFSKLFMRAYFLDIRYVGVKEFLSKEYSLSRWMSSFLSRYRTISKRRSVRVCRGMDILRRRLSQKRIYCLRQVLEDGATVLPRGCAC